MATGGFSTQRLDRMRVVLGGYVERGELPGLVALVSRGEEMRVEALGMQAFGGAVPMARDTIFRIASMTKPITAVAALILIEECAIRLDDPVERWLPELAERRVLRRLDGPLDDTVPAQRPISVRDLLTCRMGLGHLLEATSDFPIQRAIDAQQLLQGPPLPEGMPGPDEWIRRVGTLPLAAQPGARWLYDLGLDVLGVLIERATGQTLEAFFRARIFAPLGMKDTGFSVPPGQRARLADSYQTDLAISGLAFYDGAGASQWNTPPAFRSGAGGLVSTVDDYHAFYRMLLNKGRYGGERILSRPAVELMLTDQLTPAQKVRTEPILGANDGWGFGISVRARRDDLWSTPGRFGWAGGLGTAAYCDPAEGVIDILMTQRSFDSPGAGQILSDFWTLVYGALDD